MTESLSSLANAIRGRVLELTPTESPSHLTSALSVVEILAAVYGGFVELDGIRRQADDRDRVILSKGHAALALYAALAECDVIPAEAIQDYGPGALNATVHPVRGRLVGIETTSGSLGHGLAVATGMAIANTLRSVAARTIVILGDGELQEGSNWEAMLFAGNKTLPQLCAIVDLNGLQQTGRLSRISDLQPLAEKWQAFGWYVEQVDGHDPDAILAALTRPRGEGRPRAILADTVKGRGIAGLEDREGWHFRKAGPVLGPKGAPVNA